MAMSENYTTFRERLALTKGKESINTFAKGCGLTPACIRKYLNSDTEPGIEKVLAISKYTGKSLAWLITGKEESPSRQTQALSPEEIKVGWDDLSRALTPVQTSCIILTFRQRGVLSVFNQECLLDNHT